MSRYLFRVSYTPQSWAALTKSPENRLEAIRPMFDQVGGKIESFYFAFGPDDAVVIADLPDNVSAGALAVAAAASGSLSKLETTVLMTVEEAEQVMRKAAQISYVAPGARSAAGVP